MSLNLISHHRQYQDHQCHLIIEYPLHRHRHHHHHHFIKFYWFLNFISSRFKLLWTTLLLTFFSKQFSQILYFINHQYLSLLNFDQSHLHHHQDQRHHHYQHHHHHHHLRHHLYQRQLKDPLIKSLIKLHVLLISFSYYFLIPLLEYLHSIFYYP